MTADRRGGSSGGDGSRSVEGKRVDVPPYSFWEYRAGSGSPLILIHGLSGSSRWWKQNFDALASRHTVSAIDLVGFGRNRRFRKLTPLPLSFEEMAALLGRWIAATWNEPVHLAGHSMGGQIAIHIAARRPELVRSLTLVCSTGIPFQVDPLPHLRALAAPPPGSVSLGRRIALDFFRAGPTSVAVAYTRLLFNDARDEMKKIEAPTLLVWGENDILVPPKYGALMASEIRGSRMVTLPKAGHVAMWDAPGEFNRTLLDFLAECDAKLPDDRTQNLRRFQWGISDVVDGICHREAGHRRQIVLIHGLGMSGAYFHHLALQLFEAGFDPIAPDLPGFGSSDNAAIWSSEEHAQALITWAEKSGITSAVWLGHSNGAEIVEAVARSRPGLVRASVLVTPVLSSCRYSIPRLLGGIVVDGLFEPFELLWHALRDYLRAGPIRIVRSLHAFAREKPRESPARDATLILAGRRDPTVRNECLGSRGVEVHVIEGTHGLVVSNPEGIVGKVRMFLLQRPG